MSSFHLSSKFAEPLGLEVQTSGKVIAIIIALHFVPVIVGLITLPLIWGFMIAALVTANMIWLWHCFDLHFAHSSETATLLFKSNDKWVLLREAREQQVLELLASFDNALFVLLKFRDENKPHWVVALKRDLSPANYHRLRVRLKYPVESKQTQ